MIQTQKPDNGFDIKQFERDLLKGFFIAIGIGVFIYFFI